MGKIKGLGLMLVGAAGGAALAHFFDPDRGRTRRAQASDQLESLVRSGIDEATREVDYRAGQAKGAVAERVDLGSDRYDVHTLRNKIESEAIGPAGVPTGEIIVEVKDDQTVTLRGAVATRDKIEEVVRRTHEVDGVRDVENLLHLPGEPAPNVQPSVEASEARSG